MISSVAIAVLYVVVSIDILDAFGLPVGSLVAPAAVLGAALGFGARLTKLRTGDGEVYTVPNGQIVESLNLSKDWARDG